MIINIIMTNNTIILMIIMLIIFIFILTLILILITVIISLSRPPVNAHSHRGARRGICMAFGPDWLSPFPLTTTTSTHCLRVLHY